MITYGCSLPLSNERKRFQEKIALVRRVDEDPFGGTWGYPVAYIPYTPSYTEECKPCLLCGMFRARSSSGTDHNISRKECVTLVDAWGTCGSRKRCLEWWCGVMRRNNFSRTNREVEALLDHIDELGVTVQTHLRRRSGR